MIPTSYMEEPFANASNLEHCVKYLNQTLVAHGFPAPLELASHNPDSIARTCNCVYALLRRRQHDVSFRESVNDQRQRLCSDLSRLQNRVERLEGQLAAKEREIASLVAKEQKSTAIFKAQLEKLQLERDEFQRMVAGSQQVKMQHLHELKKKEKEFVKLQERLNQVLADRKKETKTGMEMMSSLHKEGRQRGTWCTKKADGDFYKMIVRLCGCNQANRKFFSLQVDAYETKKQELVAENAELRALLRSMQLDMRGLLDGDMTEVEGDEPTGLDTTLCGRTVLDTHSLAIGALIFQDVFNLPLHMARERIEGSLRSKMASIKVQRSGDELLTSLCQEHMAHHRQVDASERQHELEGQLVEAGGIQATNKHLEFCTNEEQDVEITKLCQEQLEEKIGKDYSLQVPHLPVSRLEWSLE